MAYKCPQCDYVSEQAGNCPTCNIATVEVKEETTEETQPGEAQ